MTVQNVPWDQNHTCLRTTGLYQCTQLPFSYHGYLANESTRRIKWGGRKVKIRSFFPPIFTPCQVSAGRMLLQRSQLQSGSCLHTALASSCIVSFVLFTNPNILSQESAPAYLGLVVIMVPTVTILKYYTISFVLPNSSQTFIISHFIKVSANYLICVHYLFLAGITIDTG